MEFYPSALLRASLPFSEVRTDLNFTRITATDFGYTFQRDQDAQGNVYSLGLMDFKARMYDPRLGRFLQPDSIVANPADTQAFNRYSYASNNPSRFTDPSGYVSCEGDNWDDGPQCKGKSSFNRRAIQVLKQSLADKFQWSISSGDWSVSDLRLIYQTGVDISSTIGGDDNVIKLFGKVEFREFWMADHNG